MKFNLTPLTLLIPMIAGTAVAKTLEEKTSTHALVFSNVPL